MISRLAGAIARAFLVASLVAAPYILLPVADDGISDVIVFLALAAAAFVLLEYTAVAPSIMEFRDAPPFNRLRFFALFATILTLVLLRQAAQDGSTLSRLVAALAEHATGLLDFPFSPVRLAVLMVPAGSPPALIADVRVAAGTSYIMSIAMLGIFWLCIRFAAWPAREGGFNIWVNLPTFDPMAGGDIAARLRRDAQVNAILGFLLPFILPVAIRMVAAERELVSLADPHNLIWTMTAWAFLPAMLVMRGLALWRVSRMIEAQRARAVGADKGLLPA